MAYWIFGWGLLIGTPNLLDVMTTLVSAFTAAACFLIGVMPGSPVLMDWMPGLAGVVWDGAIGFTTVLVGFVLCEDVGSVGSAVATTASSTTNNDDEVSGDGMDGTFTRRSAARHCAVPGLLGSFRTRVG